MSKMVKELIARELNKRYAGATDAVWIELVGLDGLMTNEFRRSLRSKQMKLEVVKTSLLRRACASGPMAKLAQKVEGPAALVTGGQSAVEMAKALEEWAPKFPKTTVFRVRGALLDGELVGDDQVKDLAKLPTRRDVQAQVAGQILSPGGKVVSMILAGGGNIAGCLKALIEKLEKGGTAASAEAPAA